MKKNVIYRHGVRRFEMFLRWLSIGCPRSRTHTKIVIGIVWVILMVAGFEYYNYQSDLSRRRSQRFTVVVKTTANKKDPSGPDVDEEAKSQIGKENLYQPTTQSLQDTEAEKDSKRKKETVEEVCKKTNVTNVLEIPIGRDRRDRKTKLQRFNVFHHIIVNEEHKVLYCFIPKVGCSNMKKIFLVMNGKYPSIKKVNIHVMNYELIRLDNKKYTEEQRQYMLKNFYKFMIVREPFERLVSAYLNKWRPKSNPQLHATLGKRIVEKYRYNNTKTVVTGDDVKFLEYARYLIDTPPEEVNEHWMPYEDLCRPCNVKYDFIGSIETMRRDIPHVIRQIHANETKYFLQSPGRPLTRTKQTTASLLRELPRKYFNKLLAIFKVDYQLFGYPLPDYEKLNEHYPAK